MRELQGCTPGGAGKNPSAAHVGKVAWGRTPLWMRERLNRIEDRRQRALRGAATPRMQMIALVELEALDKVPDWAVAKAVHGLRIEPQKVWLRRIAARSLARLEERAGGKATLTFCAYRACRVCGRPRLGMDAEARLALDRKFEGWKIPCDGDCLELSRARKQRKHTRDA